MIAVDTNLLVYAHRPESPWFGRSRQFVRELAEGSSPWGIQWPCIHEFLGVVTNSKIYKPPTPLPIAIKQLELWMESPTLRLLGEPAGYWLVLKDSLIKAQVSGGAVHDARIAAICQSHGVREFWSADRDFSRYPNVKIRNPLVA